MSSRSWVRASSASAAIAINTLNYAYLIIQFDIARAPTSPWPISYFYALSLPRSRDMFHPTHPDGILVVLTYSSSSLHILSASTYHLCSTSPLHTCKNMRLCTYHPIHPPTTYPFTCAVMDHNRVLCTRCLHAVSLLVVPLGSLVLFILPILGVFFGVGQCITFPTWFHLLQHCRKNI